MASRGLRDINGEQEKIEDPAELAQVKRQAKIVHLEAVLAGLLLTAAVVALPV